MPWESFQALRSLTYDIYNRTPIPRELFNADVNPSTLIFAGPSSLPKLEELNVNYCNANSVYETEDLNMRLDAIYRHNLNRTIENPSSFPSLRTFHTKVTFSVSDKAAFVLDEEKLVQHVVNRLPAIFCVGGRRDSRGWVTSIVPTVLVDSD